MKIFRHTYSVLLIVAALLSACSSDGIEGRGSEPESNAKMVQVRLHIGAASQNGGTTRASSYTDTNADDLEMMNVWTVVAVHADGTDAGKVAFIHAANPDTDDREVDDLVNLPTGKYDFYSFANMAPSVVCQLMGIEGFAKGAEVTRNGNEDGSGADAGNNPTEGNDNEGPAITSYANQAENDPFVAEAGTTVDDKVYNISFTADQTINAETIAAKEVGIDGNGFDIESTNVFAAKGIPMSNKQTITITENTNVDLILVRMFAKIELRLYNETGADIKVKSVTLSDVNGNYDNNIKMLPSLTKHDDMEAHHGDIRPNLGANTYPGDYTCTPTTAVTVPSTNTLASGTYQTLAFYVNESSKPKNPYERFFLTLEIHKGTGNPSEYRYALIDDDNSNSKGGDGTTGKWDYIARNDYRIIPIVLDDYTLDIIPYDFPAIGVYPASVKNEDGLYTINFHDYGHFHLQPVVTKMSTGAKIAFNNGTPLTDGTVTWGLYNNLWTDSWTSWTDHTKATAYVNSSASPAFYRNQSATADGDEVGGEPYWYVNDGTAGPQWAPAASGNYQPFIFGYIADPGVTLAADRKVYHEFKIQLYDGTNTTARREMLARIYMILDTQQMLYAPRRADAPRRRH